MSSPGAYARLGALDLNRGDPRACGRPPSTRWCPRRYGARASSLEVRSEVHVREAQIGIARPRAAWLAEAGRGRGAAVIGGATGVAGVVAASPGAGGAAGGRGAGGGQARRLGALGFGAVWRSGSVRRWMEPVWALHLRSVPKSAAAALTRRRTRSADGRSGIDGACAHRRKQGARCNTDPKDRDESPHGRHFGATFGRAKRLCQSPSFSPRDG